MNKIIVIVGPTSVGKTKLSLALANHYHKEIINGDAMQVYKDLNIGTAKVTDEEQKIAPHHLISMVSPEYFYTVCEYQKDGRECLKELNNEAIVVGGSGLYIKALLYDYRFNEETNNNDYSAYSNEELYNIAIKKDPKMDIHVNNRKRLERFLNKDISDYVGKDKLLYDAIFIGLTLDKELLYQRINDRVEEMIKEGLLDEVKSLYDKNIRSKAIMTAIGYKELYKYFDKEISFEEAIEEIKHSSRKYAKRQFTWFNNQMNINWFNVDLNNFDNTINDVIKFIDNL